MEATAAHDLRVKVATLPIEGLQTLTGGFHFPLHDPAQRAIDPRLVAFAVLLEPCDHVCIQPQRHRLFQWTVVFQNAVDRCLRTLRAIRGSHQGDVLSPFIASARGTRLAPDLFLAWLWFS